MICIKFGHRSFCKLDNCSWDVSLHFIGDIHFAFLLDSLVVVVINVSLSFRFFDKAVYI